MNTTDTPRTDTWECFSDPSYYDMARLRRTDGPKDFNTGYHLNNLREAIEVKDILNELERRAEKAEAEVERLGGLLYETRSLLTEFFDCVDIGGLHDGDCNISTEDPEKWDLGCNCTTAELKRKYIKLYSK